MAETPKESPLKAPTPAQKIVDARQKGEIFLKKFGDDVPQTARVREAMKKMESHFDKSGRVQPTRQDYENAASFADKVIGILDGFDYEKVKVEVLKSKFYQKFEPLIRMCAEYEEKYYSAMDIADDAEASKYRNYLSAANIGHAFDQKMMGFYQELSSEDRKRLGGQVLDVNLTIWQDHMVPSLWKVTFQPDDYSVARQSKEK